MARWLHNCSRWRACAWWNGRSTDQPPRKAPDFSQAVQSSLFQERSSNVIAMPPRVEIKPRIRTDVPARPSSQKPAARRAKPVPEGQGTPGFPAARVGQTAPVGHHRGSGDLLRSAGRYHAPPRCGLRARLEHGAARVRALPARLLLCWAASSSSPRAT